MKEPYPFLPLWEVKRGELAERGSGLLPGNRDVQYFKVFPGQFVIEVQPLSGVIQIDGSTVASLDKPCKLVWFRRMQFELGTRDENHYRPDCLWYGIGLDCDGSIVGYELYRDGTLKPSTLN